MPEPNRHCPNAETTGEERRRSHPALPALPSEALDYARALNHAVAFVRLAGIGLLILILSSCTDDDPAADTDSFALLDDIEVQDNQFDERTFRNDLYEVKERTPVPEFVGNIYQLHEGERGIYLNDPQAVHRYDAGQFETVFDPPKGEGPGEVNQVFRFDVRGDTLVAIAGYPGNRFMLHNLETDSTRLVQTTHDGNVLVDREGNIYGEASGASPDPMITKFSPLGDSLTSFGRLFSSQDRGLNMFDVHWDYNETHDAIILGFMHVGYFAVLDPGGSLRYITESTRHPGEFPTLVKQAGMRFVDTDGSSVLRDVTTNRDEVHIFTANAARRSGDVYGAVIDVIDVRDGTYQFSYVLEEPLHWPILLLDDYSIAAVTRDYELVIWERQEEPAS